jgi:hypothetical protein
MRKIVPAVLIALLAGSAAALASAQTIRKGQYFYSHTVGDNSLTGDLTLGRADVSNIGVTTDLLTCSRPGHKPFFPGPPFNWQPQKTFPVKHLKAGLKLSFTAAFNDRLDGFPEKMTMVALITSKGITGKVKLYADDKGGSSGEEICHTRGFVDFAGKHQ